jgi:single-strand DNA-binding protein
MLIGNLGREPEMRYTPSGQAVTSFSVAVDESYTGNDGQRVKRTIWVRVSAWGKQAETCNQYLKKGSKVGVTGRLTPGEGGSPRIWTKTDGTPAASFEVNASEVHFLGGGNGANGASAEEASAEQGEEIPF